MQLLTNRGFVGIADVEAYASLSLVHRAQNPLLFATYNESRDQLEYQEATHFVFNAAGAEMVEFTHSNEQRCWDAASDKYGRTPAQVSRAAKQSLKNQKSNAMNSASEGEEIAAAERNEDSSHPSNGVSLLVTFNHDMFVQEGKRVGGGQLGTRWKMRIARDEEGEPLRRARGRKEEEEIVPPSKVRADQLLSDDVNRRLKLTGFAEKGVRIPLPEDAGGDSRAWRMPFVARLKLADSNTVRTAFLEIYGQLREHSL